MPNPIKYTTGSETLALKKGDFYLGTGDVGKGPTSITGYYNGINPPSGGYTVYVNKELEGPSIFTASNDAELISITKSISDITFTSATECLVYFDSQNDKLVCNIEYENIITDGLVLNVDAGFSPSYPTSGVTWNDISGGNNNGTLTNGPTFSFNGGGSIIFDGINDYVEVVRSTNYDFNQTNSFTIVGWFFINSTTTNSPYLGKWGSNSISNGSYLLWTGGITGNRLVFSVALGTSTIASTPPVLYNFNQWNYFVGVYVSGTRLESYLNNGNANITNYTGNINNPTNVNLRIGKFDATPETFNGGVSSVQIYNRALTSEEILQNYNATKNRYIFTSTWNTANTSAGSSTSTQIKLPLVSTGTYNMLVDWGDGTTDTITTWNQAETTHTYSSSGVYEIKISGRCRGFRFANTGDRLKLLNISQYGVLDLSTDSSFFGCTNFNSNAADAPIISTTSFSGMFLNCTNFNGNIGNWNTSNVTTFFECFQGCTNFNNGGSPSINNWNTQNVTNMRFMFRNCFNFNQPIGGWNVSNVTNMDQMFSSCSVYNNGGVENLNNWNTSNVTNMGSMFFNCFKFNKNIGGWDLSNVTNITGMFHQCFDFNNGGSDSINNWDISKITSLSVTFFRCTNFNQPIGNWDTSNVTSMLEMLSFCTKFNQPLNDWNTSKLVNTFNTFKGCTNFNQPIGNWDTSKITNMNSMLSDCPNFNQDLSNWDTSNVTNMLGLFLNNGKFDNGGTDGIGNWNTSNVTNMANMFFGCLEFNRNISTWDVSNVTTMSSMFINARKFNQNISIWDVNKVSNFIAAFVNAFLFNQNLSSWNLRLSGTNLNEIFANSGMSCQNYTDTIVGWANYVASNSNTPINVNMAIQSGRRFDGTRSGGAGFASATAARTFLTTATPTGAGWTISGDVLGAC